MTSKGMSTVSPLLGFWLVISLIGLFLCYFGYQAVRNPCRPCAGVNGDQASQDSQDKLNGMEDDQCVKDVEDDRNRNFDLDRRRESVDRRRQTNNDDYDAGLDLFVRRRYPSSDRENSRDRRYDDRDDRRGRSQTNLNEGDRTWLDLFNPDLKDRESDSNSTYSSGSQSESGTPELLCFILNL